jgi:hypothetical protein
MRGYYGFPGDVSFQPQVRIKAAYRGCGNITGVPLQLSGVEALPSGSYRGAPGVRVQKGTTMIRQRDQDMALFYQMGIPIVGPAGRMRSGRVGVAGGEIMGLRGGEIMGMRGLGSVTDRQACAASFTVGSGLYNAAMAAVAASQPGATQEQRDAAARLTAQLGAGGTGISALANLCNLANDGNPPVGSVDPQDLVRRALAVAQAQAQAQTLWGQGSSALTMPGAPMSTGVKVAIGVGVLAVVGAGAYFLLKK